MRHDDGVEKDRTTTITGEIGSWPRAQADGGALRIIMAGGDVRVPAGWLLERSAEAIDIDESSRQRRYDPTEVPRDLAVLGSVGVDARVEVTFSDGHVRAFDACDLARWAGCVGDSDEPPAPVAWMHAISPTTISWSSVVDHDVTALHAIIGEFHRSGWFVITGAPTVPGSLIDIAGRFGRVSATSFGTLFDVESVPDPADLAYTPVGLAAHTDQPYRTPTPGLQFLHTLRNDAPGGASTVVDGLAAVEALRRADPDGFVLLSGVAVEFRYDVGHDVVVARAPMIELYPDGSLRQLRFSPRLDFTPLLDPDDFDRFHRARRWLADWFADQQHQVEFKMVEGDVLVVDNHRVLHGRRPFDPSGGHRHLQGCYIDHDGPATMWRLLTRHLSNTYRS